MIGQKKLIAKFKSYSIETLPHSMLFVGELGCGKHELVKMISQHFNLDVIDITDKITLETIDNIYISSTTCIYVIDATKINERQQNVVLKFLEEPSSNAYIIMLTTSKSLLLETVLNRCVSYEFEPYNRDELVQFLDFESGIEDLLYYCHTPGQIINTTKETLDATISLVDNIITNIRKARFSNTLKIPSSVSKLDAGLFFRVLLERLYLKYVDNHDIIIYNMYEYACEYYKRFNTQRFDVDSLISSLTTELWEVCKR